MLTLLNAVCIIGYVPDYFSFSMLAEKDIDEICAAYKNYTKNISNLEEKQRTILHDALAGAQANFFQIKTVFEAYETYRKAIESDEVNFPTKDEKSEKK